MAKTGRTASSESLETLDRVIDRLKAGGCKKEAFYMVYEDGRLTVGWLSEDPDESRLRRERMLNLGERVSLANVRQSIDAAIRS